MAVPRTTTHARRWAMQAVQWDPARNGLKHGAHAYAAARGRWLQATGRLPRVPTIYTAGSPRAGSQFMKALFDHPLVRARTGLFTLPQLYSQISPGQGFPVGTFVPGLYVSHPEYVAMRKPRGHRLVYMFRDPRDVVVSGYYAAVASHRPLPVPAMERLREELRRMPLEEGLTVIIREGASRLREIATWVDVDDEQVAKFRLEDVADDPAKHVDGMLAHCGVELSGHELDTVLADVSRESLRTQDLAHRHNGAASHYRGDPVGFRELFGPEHHAAVESIVPGLAERLGYPD